MAPIIKRRYICNKSKTIGKVGCVLGLGQIRKIMKSKTQVISTFIIGQIFRLTTFNNRLFNGRFVFFCLIKEDYLPSCERLVYWANYTHCLNQDHKNEGHIKYPSKEICDRHHIILCKARPQNIHFLKAFQNVKRWTEVHAIKKTAPSY